MSSGGSLVFGEIGDWTWEAVSASCQTNVYAARTADGDPIYLSFYYYRVRGGKIVHPHGLGFGDELDLTSQVFQFGSRSILTLHVLAPAELGRGDFPVTPEEFYENPHSDCMYVENFNRWVTRGPYGANSDLAATAPSDFQFAELPRIPNRFSPRTVIGRAREAGTFCADLPPGFVADPVHRYEYSLDSVRDVNGAGLMYFASYFAIFDTALLRRWRELGRDDAQFLKRRVVDQKLGFFGNADLGSVFTISVRRWCDAARPELEIADLNLRDAVSGRLLAATSIEIESGW